MVPLAGATLAEALEAYFAQSEQVETVLRLAADDVAAGGVMLQKMPATGGQLPEDYDPEVGRVFACLPKPSRAKNFSRCAPRM